MKKTLLFFVGVLVGISSYSQSVLHVFEDWSSTAGSQNFFHKNVTKTDGSSNVYVAGATLNGSGNYDILLAKYNSSGVQQWIVQYNGAGNNHDAAIGLYIDGSSNVYITGVVTTSSNIDMVTIKYNSSGTQQWLSTYDGTGSTYDCGSDLVVDASGNVYATGASTNASGNSDYVTIKYNSSGTQQWATLYDYTTNLNDAPVKIAHRAFTGVVTVSGAVQSSSSVYKVGVITYNDNTGAQTGATISSGGSSGVDQVFDMTTDASGNIYIAGGIPIAGQGYNTYVVKLDASLIIQWESTYNGLDSLDDMAHGVKVDASGNVFITGYTTTNSEAKNTLTLKYNSSGTQQWIETYNDTLDGDDVGNALVLDGSSNVYVAGYDSTALNGTDYYTIKYNTSGTEIWNIRDDGDAHRTDKATNIANDANGNIVITGVSQKLDGSLEYKTIKYVERNIITPTDFSSESAQTGFDYFENKGQLVATDTTLVPDIKYYSLSMSPALYFKNNSYSMVFAQIDTAIAQDTLHRIDITYNQVNSGAKTYAMEEQEYYNNYYLGHIPQGITQVHSNKRLVTPNLYTNIDVEYSSNQNGFKYYFIVKPGAVPTTIQMEYTGASSFNIDGTTNALTINSTVGSITYDRPIVYQINSSNVISSVGWTADWQTNGASNKYKFNTGAYDSAKVLVIVVSGVPYSTLPAGTNANLCWSTYIGGGLSEQVNGIDVDASGSQFVVGSTNSLDFPLGTGTFQPALSAGADAFLLKFRNTHLLLWGTYIGGSGDDDANDVKVRRFGNTDPYIVGASGSTNFPQLIKPGAYYDTTGIGDGDGFIAEFANATGFGKWIACFGGTGTDEIYSLDFDTSDRLFIAGFTNSSSGFPLAYPGGAYTQTYGSGGDAFIARFNTSDNFDWSSFYGGSGADYGLSLKVDNWNNIFLYGYTGSADFPTTNPAGAGDFYDGVLSGVTDAFIVKFDYPGAVKWATYIGGSSLELVGKNSLAINSYNDIYIGGITLSSDFPLKNSSGFFDSTFTGVDGFVMKFSGANFDTILSTYISGNSSISQISVNAIAINNDDEVFISGMTVDTIFPLFQQGGFYYQDTMSGALGGTDGFLVALDLYGHQIFGTYFGGYNSGNQEQIFDLAIFNDYLYAVGQTNTSDTNSTRPFPLIDPGLGAYYDTTFNGNTYDGFVSMFCIGSVTGIEESTISNNNGSFFVYPNPTLQELNIKLNKGLDDNATVELYSIEGKLVYSYMLLRHQESMNIDVRGLSQGLYFLRIRNAEFDSTIKFSKY